ncbi:MAG: hypothetical protein FWD97_10710 [Defluviitaleaceae bacterium]|nr:hypothetical protein [Defluviitaleaceae bacterium]
MPRESAHKRDEGDGGTGTAGRFSWLTNHEMAVRIRISQQNRPPGSVLYVDEFLQSTGYR